MGGRLEAKGHDIRALDQQPELEGLDDDDVLALAAEEGRILVTHNVSDFPPMLREWAATGRPHVGAILIYGIDHSELIARGIERWLAMRPKPEDWIDFSAVLDRDFASR